MNLKFATTGKMAPLPDYSSKHVCMSLEQRDGCHGTVLNDQERHPGEEWDQGPPPASERRS